MAIELFINSEYIKELTFVDENVDEKYLKLAIYEAQNVRIKDVLGTALYNTLYNNSAAGTLTAAQTTLIDTYIAPALKYWALVEVSPFLLYKIRNKSIGTKSADNFEPDQRGMEFILDNFENKAEYYTQRLIEYLIENHLTFPDYDNPGTGYDTIYPRKNIYDCGIWTGNNHSLPKGIDIDKGNFFC